MVCPYWGNTTFGIDFSAAGCRPILVLVCVSSRPRPWAWRCQRIHLYRQAVEDGLVAFPDRSGRAGRHTSGKVGYGPSYGSARRARPEIARFVAVCGHHGSGLHRALHPASPGLHPGAGHGPTFWTGHAHRQARDTPVVTPPPNLVESGAGSALRRVIASAGADRFRSIDLWRHVGSGVSDQIR